MKLSDKYIDFRLSSTISHSSLISNIFLPIEEQKENIIIATSKQSNEILIKQYFEKNIVFEIYPEEEILAQVINIEQKIAINNYFQNNKLENLINSILLLSILYKSSDIHIEPNIIESNNKEKSLCVIRFRIDGKLSDIIKLPIEALPMISSRVKLSASMDIVEKRKPQNGRFSSIINKRKFDFRVSSMPLIEYESIVIRILGRYDIKPKLELLGYSHNSLKIIKDSINLSSGLILVCGATGSGKTTTLYSMLNQINDGSKKIITIEDPVEYNVSNTQQIQIEEDIGLTFEIVLKNILRQDPDIIVIGEIRDKQSLKIAIEASMTGHLVMATLHTNSVIESIARLYEMGMEAYFISSSLRMITAGRLVQRICQDCKQKGCKRCNYTGYQGRTIAEETISISEDLRELILNKSSQDTIKSYLLENDFISIDENIKRKREEGLI